MIELKSVTVSRQGNRYFENLNLQLSGNNHYVIQGSNGAGKTLLLEVLAGVAHLSSGEIIYDFIPGHLDWDQRFQLRQKKIHYIPAHALQQLVGNQTNYYYQQRYYTIGDTQLPTVKEFLGADVDNLQGLSFPESFMIAHLLPLELTRLSNGQLKKVLIIKHLLRGLPDVLLLDYPFEGLDQQSRIELCDLIDHLAQSMNIQVILTDHHHELPRVINKRIVIDQMTVVATEDITPSAYHFSSASMMAIQSVQREPVVEMKDLTIQYGSKKIIENLNWRINKGERWALTGRNGSGKTTLFSLIFADHPLAYSQKVFLFGRRRGSGESIWDIKRRINYLGPEHIHFLNAGSITISGRQYLEQRKIDSDAVDKIAAHFDATSFIDKPVRYYSSGQLQLTLLMLFFSEEKELLLLDEPFQFLDPAQKENVNKFLNDYLHEDSTLVLITHYSAYVEKWTQLKMSL